MADGQKLVYDWNLIGESEPFTNKRVLLDDETLRDGLHAHDYRGHMTVPSLIAPHGGTLIDRIYDRSGIRLLGLLDLTFLFRNVDTSEAGVLNLLGSSNPLGSTGANYIVWGNVANYSGSYYIVWGNTIQSPSGQYIVWGNSEATDGSYIVWGNMAGSGH